MGQLFSFEKAVLHINSFPNLQLIATNEQILRVYRCTDFNVENLFPLDSQIRIGCINLPFFDGMVPIAGYKNSYAFLDPKYNNELIKFGKKYCNTTFKISNQIFYTTTDTDVDSVSPLIIITKNSVIIAWRFRT
jgi:hypothetical protein